MSNLQVVLIFIVENDQDFTEKWKCTSIKFTYSTIGWMCTHVLGII